MRVLLLFLLNLGMVLAWGALQESFTASTLLFGFLLSFLVLSALHRGYARSVLGVFGYLLFLAWSIVVASFQVAGYVLSPRLKLDQGIVAIPLTVRSDLEIAILASSITLTPGTLSVDVGHSPTGERVLYVHSLVMGDPEALRRTLQRDFEQRILQITRGEK